MTALNVILPWALALFSLAMLLATWRLLRGPTWPDRILALDTLYVNALAVVLLLGIQFDTPLFFDAAWVIALLGFIGTVALSKFVARGNIVE
jgi:multicomponent K+:H+ antiporter subunit F